MDTINQFLEVLERSKTPVKHIITDAMAAHTQTKKKHTTTAPSRKQFGESTKGLVTMTLMI